ncbi:MAG: hypothetical protein HY074_16260 [Deltaproteobacteria bacterium]|nr:hypothetical protein [Deltaproteobacteria bacterium]
MEQRFFKVRLSNGRVIGPLDLDRIKIFIFKDKITGLEMARLYPTGDWKDINTYPEIADLLMQKLEGKLAVDPATLAANGDVRGESDGNTRASEEGIPIEQLPNPPQHMESITGTPALQMADGSIDVNHPTAGAPEHPPPAAGAAPTSSDGEATMMITSDNERTMMVASSKPGPAPAAMSVVEMDSVAREAEAPIVANPMIASEPTAMLTRPPASKTEEKPTPFGGNKKRMVVGGIIIVLAALYFLDDPPTMPALTSVTKIKVELPAQRAKQDPQKSEKIFKNALPIYYRDTVEGYTQAAELFKDAASWDSNNVRALCLLASCYMNLFDVVDRTEVYFNVITKIIEMERAKGVDLAETVIADVELYHILGNPDAAFNRIVEFAKTHEWGMDMIYYLALSFYLKGQYAEALQQLNKIDQNNFFSPKISYLYGMIFEKNAQPDDAIKAFLFTINKSPKHVKARVKLAELYFSKDNLPESGKHADFIITHKGLASRSELAHAHYYHAKMEMVANRMDSALKSLDEALKLTPEDQDILLDYYTLKSKHGAAEKGASGIAKMFAFMALGEKSLKDDHVDEALGHFLSAREANDHDPAPLARIAEVFTRKGDLQSAIINIRKAIELAPKTVGLYPKYIRTLIQGYEFEEAKTAILKFQEQAPDNALLDRLNGELFYKQEKYQEANLYLKRALNASNFDSSVYTAYGSLMFKTNNFRDAAFYMGLALRFDPFNVAYGNLTNKRKEALDEFTSYSNLAPLDPSGHIERSKIFLTRDEKGRTDILSAKVELLKVIEQYPRYPGIHFMLGDLFNQAGDNDKALMQGQEEVKNNPSFIPAYVLVTTIMNKVKQHQDALNLSNVVLKTAPNYAPILLQAGVANRGLKNYAAAQSMLERAATLDAGNPLIWKELGLLYYDISNFPHMKEAFKKYLDMFPDAPDKAEVEDYLKKVGG